MHMRVKLRSSELHGMLIRARGGLQFARLQLLGWVLLRRRLHGEESVRLECERWMLRLRLLLLLLRRHLEICCPWAACVLLLLLWLLRHEMLRHSDRVGYEDVVWRFAFRVDEVGGGLIMGRRVRRVRGHEGQCRRTATAAAQHRTQLHAPHHLQPRRVEAMHSAPAAAAAAHHHRRRELRLLLLWLRCHLERHLLRR